MTQPNASAQWFWTFVIVCVGVCLGYLAFLMTPEPEPSAIVTHHAASQSWDQGNLKRNDHGCPTAIYVAPHGTLELCPITFAEDEGLGAVMFQRLQ
jgi:hypothetical protein